MPQTPSGQEVRIPGTFDVGQKANQFFRWAGDQLGTNPVASRPEYQFDWNNFNQDRAGQQALLQQYQQMAAGNGPSLAQGQLQQATDQNIAQAMALGAAQQGQGLGYASALRNIADQSAAARQQAAAQSAMIRNAEQMQAMQGQGALLGQMQAGGLQQQGMGAANAFNYAGLNANIDLQNQQAKRQLAGGVLNAGGGLLETFINPTQKAHGGIVEGYARGGGPMDSTKNDTVPAMLSPGEIVIPRSITMAPNAGELSKMFVEMVQMRRDKPMGSSEHPAVRDMMRKRKAA